VDTVSEGAEFNGRKPMLVPKCENDGQWLLYLESERLRIRQEMLSGRLSASRLTGLQAQVDDLDDQIKFIQLRMASSPRDDQPNRK
jgi:hypothetical protein